MKKLLCLLLVFAMLLPNLTVFAAATQTEPETEPVLVETEPVETEPVETDPVETDPVETDPVETEPVETEPVETEPVETEPVETEPVETEPVETEPVETEPVETEPVETELIETEPVEEEEIEVEEMEFSVPAFKAVPYSKPVPKTVSTSKTVKVVEEVSDGVYTYTEKVVTDEHQLPIESVLELRNQSTAALSISGEDSYRYFETFEDLKQLIKETDDNTLIYAYYQGTEPLVISENVTLPKYMYLYAYSSQITIAKDATFVTNCHIGADKLVINGTAYLQGFNVSSLLEVNGTLYLTQSGSLDDGATLTGYDNIVFGQSWNGISFSRNIKTMSQLTAALKDAANETNPRLGYNLQIQGKLTISKSVTIPENTEMYTWSAEKLTLKAGCTLTNNGYLSIGCPFAVNGTLKNNANINLDNVMTIGSNGSYDGSGRIAIYTTEDDLPKNYIKGVSMDDFEAKHYSDYSNYWELRNIKGMKKLAKPTNLTWGKLYDYWYYSKSAGEYKQKDITAPGAISYKPKDKNAEMMDITFYNKSGNIITSWGRGLTDEMPEWDGEVFFILTDPSSGTYHFTVTAEGDYEKYYSSDTVKSKTFKYTKPSQSVGKCRSVAWNGSEVSFKAPSSTSYVGGYEVQFFYSPTKSGTPTSISINWTYGSKDVPPGLSLGSWAVQENGAGYYTFKVRALSNDITKRANGAWSDFSAPIYLEPLNLKIKNTASTGIPKLTWNKVKGAEEYWVWRSESGKYDYTKLKVTTNTSYTDSKAKVGVAYDYIVQAYADDDETYLTENQLVTNVRDLPRPNVTIKLSSGDPKISWSKVSGAKSYAIYRSTKKSSGFKKIDTVTGTSFTDETAEAGTTYYYKVKAVHKNADATSAYSTVKYIKAK